MQVTAPVAGLAESVFNIGDRLEELLKQARDETHDGTLTDNCGNGSKPR